MGSSLALQLSALGGPPSGVPGTCSLLGHCVPRFLCGGSHQRKASCACCSVCLSRQWWHHQSLNGFLLLEGELPARQYLCAASDTCCPCPPALAAKETGLRVDITFLEREPQPWSWGWSPKPSACRAAPGFSMGNGCWISESLNLRSTGIAGPGDSVEIHGTETLRVARCVQPTLAVGVGGSARCVTDLRPQQWNQTPAGRTSCFGFIQPLWSLSLRSLPLSEPGRGRGPSWHPRIAAGQCLLPVRQSHLQADGGWGWGLLPLGSSGHAVPLLLHHCSFRILRCRRVWGHSGQPLALGSCLHWDGRLVRAASMKDLAQSEAGGSRPREFPGGSQMLGPL